MSGPGCPGRGDSDLVRQFQASPDSAEGRSAAGELLGRYRGAAYLWCFRMVRDHDLAMDLAQDALLDVWRGLAAFQGRSQFSSWLFSIVRNRCRTALRPRSLVRDEDAEPDDLADHRGDPEALLVEKEGREGLERLLVETLEPLDQDAVWLRCVERLPVEEITRILDLRGASGARGLLQTARRKLRAELRRRTNPAEGDPHE